MVEPVSGVILNGESALLPFFRSFDFENFVVAQCRIFQHFHHAATDDREDDSIRNRFYESSLRPKSFFAKFAKKILQNTYFSNEGKIFIGKLQRHVHLFANNKCNSYVLLKQ
jgi:hypothetical protein